HFSRSFVCFECRGSCGVVDEGYAAVLYRSDFRKPGFMFRLLGAVFRLFQAGEPIAWFCNAGPLD
ncbi:MAG: hypothetical protein AAGF86_20150, partial [Pseudomonadota bacterium]